MIVKVLRILSSLACCCFLFASAVEVRVNVNEDLSTRYPPENPLVLSIGDTVTLVCNVVGSIYSYETLFEFTSCMTVTPPREIAICSQPLVDLNFSHGVNILNAASLLDSYEAGTTYYFVSYLDSNTTYPSGAPCSSGAKMVLHIRGDPDAVTTTDTSPVQSTADTDAPTVDTTQIIIIAVAASLALLVGCGVLLIIAVVCFLSKLGRKGKQDLKIESQDLNKNETYHKPNNKERAMEVKSDVSSKNGLAKKPVKGEPCRGDLGSGPPKVNVDEKKEAVAFSKQSGTSNVDGGSAYSGRSHHSGSRSQPTAGTEKKGNAHPTAGTEKKGNAQPRYPSSAGAEKKGNAHPTAGTEKKGSAHPTAGTGFKRGGISSTNSRSQGVDRNLQPIENKLVMGASNKVQPSSTSRVQTDSSSRCTTVSGNAQPNSARHEAVKKADSVAGSTGSGANTRVSSGSRVARPAPKPPVTRPEARKLPARPSQSLTTHT